MENMPTGDEKYKSPCQCERFAPCSFEFFLHLQNKPGGVLLLPSKDTNNHKINERADGQEHLGELPLDVARASAHPSSGMWWRVKAPSFQPLSLCRMLHSRLLKAGSLHNLPQNLSSSCPWARLLTVNSCSDTTVGALQGYLHQAGALSNTMTREKHYFAHKGKKDLLCLLVDWWRIKELWEWSMSR